MKYRILALWNQFRTSVMPPTAPPVQVTEMRRAFYAGVECALNKLSSEMSEGDSLDNESDLRVMQEVQKELQEFVSDVKEGRA